MPDPQALAARARLAAGITQVAEGVQAAHQRGRLRRGRIEAQRVLLAATVEERQEPVIEDVQEVSGRMIARRKVAAAPERVA